MDGFNHRAPRPITSRQITTTNTLAYLNCCPYFFHENDETIENCSQKPSKQHEGYQLHFRLDSIPCTPMTPQQCICYLYLIEVQQASRPIRG